MNALNPGSALLFMKVGVHAGETLEDIISRKSQEIALGGFAMWGYGGSTCHPLSMIRPFAAECEAAQKPITLVMEEIESNHFADPIPADEYSIDGRNWYEIDTTIHRVLGSRYALFIRDLREDEFELPLVKSKVAIGPSEGRRGDIYVQGRVDKACLVFDPSLDDPSATAQTTKRISLVADIVSPYAALLRNRH